MADLASLGVKVTNSGVAETTSGLVELAGAAGAADAASTSFGKGAENISKGASRAGASAERLTQQMGRYDRAARQSAAATSNLAAQFQDIFVMLAAGQNPLQLAIQQGSQIAYIFGQSPGGAAGAVGMLKAGFLSLGAAIPTVAIIAALGYLTQYVMKTKEVEDVNDVIKTHRDLLKSLEAVYSGASTAAEEYGTRSVIALEAAASRSRSALVTALQEAQRELMGATSQGGWTLFDFLLPDPAGGTIALRFAPFTEAITELRRGVAAGDPDFTRFREQLEAMAQARPDLAPVAAELQGLIDPAEKAAVALEDTANRVEELDKERLEAARFITGLNGIEEAAKKAQEQVGGLAESIRDMKAGMDAFLGGAAPKGDRLRSQSMDQAQEEFDFMFEWARRTGDAFKEIDPDKPKKVREEVDRAAQSYQKLIASVEARIASTEAEIESLGHSRTAQEAAVFAMELWHRAVATGLPLGDEHQKQIKALAIEYAKLNEQLREKQALSDLMFEREQLDRTDTEQRVAEELRALYGDAYKKHLDGTIADNIRINEVLQEQKENAKDLADTITETLGGALYEAFTGGIRSAEEFFDFVARAFSQLAATNMNNFAEGMKNLFSGKGFTFEGMTWGSGAQSSSNVKTQMVSFAKVIGLEVGKAIEESPVVRSTPAYSGNPFVTATQTGKSIGSTVAPVIESSFETGLARAMAAIKQVESGGRYGIKGTYNSKYGYPIGAYQMMESNLPQWSQQALGRVASSSEVLKDAAIQDKIASVELTRLFKKFGNWEDVFSTWHSGVPLATARAQGRADINMATVDYVKKVSGAMANLPGAVQTGALAGTEEGAATGTLDAWMGLREVTGSGAAGAGQQQGGGMGLGGLLSAGLGGFSMGMQAADPLMGALGGAMSGFAAGGIPGAIIGGLAGLLGGLLGSKKKLKAAQKELEKQMHAIERLLTFGEGTGLGRLQKIMSDYLSEIDKAVDLAWKARDMNLVARLQTSAQKLWHRLYNDFINSHDAVIQGYSSGMGEEAPMLKGARAVEELRETLRNMVADVEYWTSEVIKHSEANGVAAETLAYYREQQTRMVAEAKEAAIAMALSFLRGIEPMTEIEQQFGSLEGAAGMLKHILVELGMEAHEAAAAIETELARAINKLRTQFLDDITRSINEASGFGWMNEFLDAQERYKDRLKDSALLGYDASLANQELAFTLRQIAAEAELTDDQLKRLAEVFPEMSSAILSLVGMGSTADTAQGVADAKSALEDAKQKLRDAYEKEAQAIRDVIDPLKSYIKSLKDFRNSLRLDNALSPLSPYDKMMEAQRQYEDLVARAMSGDVEAIGELESVSRAYLEAAREYYGDSLAYFDIFNSVETTLDAVLAKAGDQLSEAEKQLAALEAQRDAQLGTTDAVLSVEEAIKQLAEAEAALAEAEAAHAAALEARFEAIIELLRQQQTSSPGGSMSVTAAQVESDLYQKVLGRSGDAAGIQWWMDFVNKNGGMITHSIIEKFAAEARKRGETPLPGYAEGGYTGDGPLSKIMGYVHAQEMVINPTATSRFRSNLETLNRTGQWPSDNDNEETLEELRAIRRGVERLVEIDGVGTQTMVREQRTTNEVLSDQTRNKRHEAAAYKRKA